MLIELPEACFLEMKTESLLFTESWTFVANALISAKNVSLQKYPSLLSYLRTGSNVVGKVFLTEFIDDWIMMRVKTDSLSVNVSISDLISTAADAAGALILNSEANFHFFLAEQKMHERCASICNLVNRSMHAPTIMTLTEVMLKISRSFPSERNRICMSLQRNNGADLAALHRIIGEERDPFFACKDASPAAEDVVTLVDCVHSRTRGKVVWEDVTNLKLGKRSFIAKSPSNTIFATELGLWFTCAEDEGDDARCVRARINMNDVQSVQIDGSDSSICAISLLSALDSFGDVSIETATSTVHVALKNSSEAQAFIADLQNKLDLFKKLDEFSRRSAVSRISCISSASTASLYQTQETDVHGTSALSSEITTKSPSANEILQGHRTLKQLEQTISSAQDHSPEKRGAEIHVFSLKYDFVFTSNRQNTFVASDKCWESSHTRLSWRLLFCKFFQFVSHSVSVKRDRHQSETPPVIPDDEPFQQPDHRTRSGLGDELSGIGTRDKKAAHGEHRVLNSSESDFDSTHVGEVF